MVFHTVMFIIPAVFKEKCGYTKEGHIRQGKMVNTWCDYYIYGILFTDIERQA